MFFLLFHRIIFLIMRALCFFPPILVQLQLTTKAIARVSVFLLSALCSFLAAASRGSLVRCQASQTSLNYETRCNIRKTKQARRERESLGLWMNIHGKLVHHEWISHLTHSPAVASSSTDSLGWKFLDLSPLVLRAGRDLTRNSRFN